MMLTELVEAYIHDKSLAWSPSTLRSERHRLLGLDRNGCLDASPGALWKAIERLAPYSRRTTWIRVAAFHDWAIAAGHRPGPNHYRRWADEHARLFKHVYERRQPRLSFEEAQARIQSLPHSGVRRKALELLFAGLRYNESLTFDPSRNSVVGKGGKRRRVFVPRIEGDLFTGSYRTFLRELKAAGLRPHDLRKLAATALARRGLREADLCQVMGWSSFATASAYIAPLDEAKMADTMKSLMEESHGQQVPKTV